MAANDEGASMESGIQGGCVCGDIRYRLTAPLLSCYTCHCTDCQTRSGAAFSLYGLLPISAAEITAGKPVDYVSERGTAKFCPRCGCNLWVVASVVPDYAIIRVGTLDDTSSIQPVAHIWTKSAQPWITFNAGSTQFTQQPEDPTELIRLWAERQS